MYNVIQYQYLVQQLLNYSHDYFAYVFQKWKQLIFDVSIYRGAIVSTELTLTFVIYL